MLIICKFVSFVGKLNSINFDCKISNGILQRVMVEKDLWFKLDNKLTYVERFSYIVNKSLKILGLIIRNIKRFSNVSVIKTLI